MTSVFPLNLITEQIFFVFLISLCYLTSGSLLRQKKIQDYPWRRVFVDNSCHMALGFISWLIASSVEVKRSRWTLFSALLCGLCAGFVDIDHFIEARSFHLSDALNLHRRPFLHNTTFMLVSIISLISVSYYAHLTKFEYFSWILLIAVMSHHIRDSYHRGLWLWPIETAHFNSFTCIGMTYFLAAFIGFFMNNLHKPAIFIDLSIV